jgi:abhydrolase domain-containing protein 1/3
MQQSQTIREVDLHFTIKQFGYKNVDEYYRDATLDDKLHQIEVPTLCLSAADDPFQPLQGRCINIIPRYS